MKKTLIRHICGFNEFEASSGVDRDVYVVFGTSHLLKNYHFATTDI